MKRALALWILGLIVSAQVFAQTRNLSGKVTDATTGEALIGVNVSGKGTTTGTVTDIDGKYTLELPKEVTALTFSYVGYTTIEKPITSLTINVSMASDQQIIDEVVVTALGLSKAQKSISYASQDLSGDKLINNKETNLANQLSGRIAGVQVTNSSGGVGSSSRLIIRGVSTITGSGQPLYVVDGVPLNNASFANSDIFGGFDMPNGINAINPDDIENVQVLKGAGATALYGVRASNGVVLITTKKGTTKGEKKKIGVDISTSLEFQKVLVLPEFQNSYGQGGVINGGRGSAIFDFNTDDASIDESWGPALDRGLEFIQWESYLNGGKPTPWISHPNNVKDFYNTGSVWNNSVAIYGNTDKSSYRMSFSSLNQKGILHNTDYNRYTVGLNASHKVVDKLTASFDVNYSKEKSANLPEVGYTSFNTITQLVWSARNADLNALKDWRNLPVFTEEMGGQPIMYGTPMNWNKSFGNNAYWYLENAANKLNKDRIIGNVKLSFDVTKHINLMIRSGLDYFNLLTTSYKPFGSYDVAVQYEHGYFSEVNRNYYELNNEFLASYNQKFVNNKLGVSLALGGNLMQQRYKSIGLEANALELPGLYNISNVRSGFQPIANNNITESNLNTVRSMGELSWNSIVYANFTLTNDWSSRLPKNNNSFMSYSVGGSVILSELMKKNNQWINLIKIRGSYASVGNFGSLAPYSTMQNLSINTDFSLGSPLLFNPSVLNNPNIKPERTREWEVGLDLKLLKNKLGISATYYDKLSSDLIMNARVSSTSGYNSSILNVGKISNKGIELQVNANLLDKKDYKIEVGLNWAKNYNKVLSLTADGESFVYNGFSDGTLEANVNDPLGNIRGYAYQRDPNGNIVYKDGIAVFDRTKKVVLGNIQPKWTGGVSVDIYIKGLIISSLFDMKIGGSIYSNTISYGMHTGVLKETLLGRETGIVGNGVKNIGTDEEPQYVQNDVVAEAESFYKGLYNPSFGHEGSVVDASYIKWRRLYVGYQIPSKFFKHVNIESIGFGITASNLLILHRNTNHIDPETATGDDIYSQGIEFGQIPSLRNIGFNFNIKF